MPASGEGRVFIPAASLKLCAELAPSGIFLRIGTLEEVLIETFITIKFNILRSYFGATTIPVLLRERHYTFAVGLPWVRA